MKFARFFGLLSAFFALVLLFSACNALPTDDDNKSNGSIFYLKHSDNKHIFISIYSSKSKQINPQAGDKYALAVLSENADGSVKYSGPPNSEGELTSATGGKLNFKPKDSSQEAGLGSISGTSLIMETVPGYPSYTNLNLKFLKDATLSSNNPFVNIDISSNSGGGGGGDDGDDNSNSSNEVIIGTTFTPGNYVKKIQFKNTPTTPRTVYEGQAVSISGTVTVTYSDGSEIDKPINVADPTKFYIDPPYYYGPGSQHTLYYVEEYSDPSTAGVIFYAPISTNLTDAAKRTIFYEFNNAVEGTMITTTGLQSIKYFEGYGFDLSGVNSQTKFRTYPLTGTSATVLTATANSTYIRLYNYAKLDTTAGTTATLYFGNKPDPRGTVSTFNPSKDIYRLDRIKSIYAPFTRQITFDDPRFFSTNTSDYMSYWYSHLSDATIGLSYKDVILQQTIRVVDAAMKLNTYPFENYNTLAIVTPTAWSATAANNILNFTYGTTATGSAATFPLEIPLYSNLTGIEIVPKKSGTILLEGAKSHNENTFLRQVTVNAIYQSNASKNNTNAIKKPVFVGPLFEGFYYLCINGSYTTNLNAGGILNEASSNQWDKKKKPQKAEVTLNAYNGEIKGTVGTPQTAIGSLPIGVTGYN